MRLDEIKIPPKLEEWLKEFRKSPYYIGARETLKREQVRKTKDGLHEQYEYALQSNRLGRVWMQLYGDPEMAMEEILNVPSNGEVFDRYERRDFVCNMCMIMELESPNATASSVVTTKTFPRQALLDYVGKIKVYVTEEWKDKVDDLWNELLDEQRVIDFIMSGRSADVFNHYVVHRIVAVLRNRGVYEGNDLELSKALEDGNMKAVKRYRTKMSKGVGEIEDIIKRCVPVK